ncbi:hypothetical protein BDR06DRAFT_1060089 [Suillus hirtellus]|nr:hypothetical protein BDR06DRAFT_1060089 [Suillus hirtellus]
MEIESQVILPRELDDLSSFIQEKPESLATATAELRAIALRATKFIFDLAPQTRSQTRANAKRKRSPSPVLESPKKDMNEGQIWQQLDLRAAPLCSNLLLLEGETEDDMELPDGMYDDQEDEEGDEELSEDEEDDSDHHPSLLDIVKVKSSVKHAVAKRPKSDLDNDFFSMDAFNRETEEAKATAVSRGQLRRKSDDDDDKGDSIDPFRPIDDVYDSNDNGSEDGAEPLYKDFFNAPRGSDMTTYEKRMAALQLQIKELEAENVAKKDWVLMGEATSRSRPQDSLLQEDLEFERTMKVVPVITETVVQGLEERIKACIKDGRFDDVVWIHAIDDKPFLPSRFFELQDTKSSQSLAQIYEDEYVVAQNGGTGGDDRDVYAAS